MTTNARESVAAQVIAAAAAQVGYHEGRSGGHWDNIEKYAAQVPGLAWANGQPWCDVFVAWCFKAAGALDLIPVTASTIESERLWKQRGRWSEYPAIGAQVIFGTDHPDHTGIVESFDATFVHTIEGNTNADGSPEGDGVYRKVHRRRDANVRGYGLPAFPEGIVSADPLLPRGGQPSQVHAPHVHAAIVELDKAAKHAKHAGHHARAHELAATIDTLHGLAR